MEVIILFQFVIQSVIFEKIKKIFVILYILVQRQIIFGKVVFVL